MGLEKAPKPRTNTDVPKNLPEVRIQSDNPDDVRDLEKKQSAKDVLSKLPGGEEPITKIPEPAVKEETYVVKSLTPEQKKRQADLMADLTDIDIDEENDKLSKVKIAGAEELKKRV